MFSVLTTFYTHNFLRYVARNRGAKLVIMAGFFSVLAFLIFLTYESFYYGFRYIAHDEFFRQALTLYIIELFLLVSFILVFASALLSGVTQLFRTGNNAFVMASPRYDLKPTFVLTRMITTSLWPLLVIILPALFALRHVFGLPLSGFLAALCSSVLLVVFGVLCAMLLIFIIGALLKLLGVFSRKHLVQMTLLAFAYLVGYTVSQFRGVDLVKFFQARLLDVSAPDLAPILLQFHHFPSHLTALSLYHGMYGGGAALYMPLVMLGGITFVTYICYRIFCRTHLYLWQKSEEKNNTGSDFLTALSHNMIRRAKGAKSAILNKEAVLFMRDARGMLWLGFILLIWVIQIASSHLLVNGLNSERIATGEALSIAGLIQFATIIYFIALFVLRFAFPAFSMERKTSWIVRMSPVDMREVFAAKLGFYVTLFGAIALIFSLGSATSVGLALPLGMPLVIGVVIATFFLTTLGLALGAKYPNQETDDPEQLSTSMPGIGFILAALMYGLIGAYTLSYFAASGNVAFYTLFVFVSVLSTLLFVKVARSALVSTAMI